MKSTVIILCSLFVINFSWSQESGIAFKAGASSTLISMSGYDIENTYEPKIGFYLGTGYFFSKKENLIQVDFEYEKIKLGDSNEATFYDEDAVKSFSDKSNEYNHLISLGGLYFFGFNNLKLGAGVSLKYLFASNTDVGGLVNVKNQSYRSGAISIPFELGYHFDQIAFALTYERGLSSRMLKKDGGISEFTNTFKAGLRYFLR